MSCLTYSCDSVFEPLDTTGYLAVANFVYHYRGHEHKNDKASIVVVGIEETRYAQYYDRITPLPRCKLRDDLRIIFNQNPRLVAIDLDLSPTILNQNSSRKEPLKLDLSASQCEEGITRDLEKQRIPVVLLTPRALPEENFERYAPAKHEWMRRLCASEHIMFAEPFLPVNWGAVTQYYRSPSSFGVVVDAVARNKTEFVRAPCRVLGLPKYGYQKNKYLSDKRAGDATEENLTRADEATEENSLRRIHFSKFHKYVSQVRWEGGGTLNGLKGKAVLFGARYGQEDLHVTPLGDMHGVDIHGAAAASELDPVRDLDLMNIFLDVGLGIGFGVVVHFFWKRYFDSSIRGSPVAYWWLVSFVLAYAIVVMGAACVAFLLLNAWGVWLSPISMAIGMFVDGFLVGGVERAREKLAQTIGYSHPAQGFSSLQSKAKVRPIFLPTIRVFLAKLPYMVPIGAPFRCFKRRARTFFAKLPNMVAIGTITYALYRATYKTYPELEALLRRLIS